MYQSLAGSGTVNMAANPPATAILPTAAGQFLRCRPVLNLPKDVFSIRMRTSAAGDNILSHKLLADISVYTFAGKTSYWWHKSARSVAHSARIGSFHFFAVASGPHQRFKAF
jgi:hypothetical protein